MCWWRYFRWKVKCRKKWRIDDFWRIDDAPIIACNLIMGVEVWNPRLALNLISCWATNAITGFGWSVLPYLEIAVKTEINVLAAQCYESKPRRVNEGKCHLLWKCNRIFCCKSMSRNVNLVFVERSSARYWIHRLPSQRFNGSTVFGTKVWPS